MKYQEESNNEIISSLQEVSKAIGKELHFDCQVKGVGLDIKWKDEKKDIILIHVVKMTNQPTPEYIIQEAKKALPDWKRVATVSTMFGDIPRCVEYLLSVIEWQAATIEKREKALKQIVINYEKEYKTVKDGKVEITHYYHERTWHSELAREAIEPIPYPLPNDN